MDGMMMDVEKVCFSRRKGWIWIWNFREKRGFLGNGKLVIFWGYRNRIRRDDGEWWWKWKKRLFFFKKKPAREKDMIFWCWKVKLKMKNGRLGSKTNWSSDQKIPANQPFQIDLDRSRSSKHRFLIKNG